MQSHQLHSQSGQPSIQLNRLFRPHLTNALIKLLKSLRRQSKQLGQANTTKRIQNELQLVQCRFNNVLAKLKRVLSVALPCFMGRQAKPSKTPFAIFRWDQLRGLVRGGLSKHTTHLSLSQIKQPPNKEWKDLRLLPRLLLSSMNKLTINRCVIDTSEWFLNFQNLVTLSLVAIQLSEKEAKAIADNLPMLEALAICNVSMISEEAVHTVINGNHHNLRELTITGCPAVSGRIIKTIAAKRCGLRRLDLRITNQGYAATERDVLYLVDLNCRLSVSLHTTITRRSFWNTIRVLLEKDVTEFNITNIWAVLTNTHYR